MLESLIRETDALEALTGDALLLVDRDGIILHATALASQFYGLPAPQLTGLPLGLAFLIMGVAIAAARTSGTCDRLWLSTTSNPDTATWSMRRSNSAASASYPPGG